MMSERIDEEDEEVVAQIAADVAQQSLADSDGSKRRKIEPVQPSTGMHPSCCLISADDNIIFILCRRC